MTKTEDIKVKTKIDPGFVSRGTEVRRFYVSFGDADFYYLDLVKQACVQAAVAFMHQAEDPRLYCARVKACGPGTAIVYCDVKHRV